MGKDLMDCTFVARQGSAPGARVAHSFQRAEHGGMQVWYDRTYVAYSCVMPMCCFHVILPVSSNVLYACLHALIICRIICGGNVFHPQHLLAEIKGALPMYVVHNVCSLTQHPPNTVTNCKTTQHRRTHTLPRICSRNHMWNLNEARL